MECLNAVIGGTGAYTLIEQGGFECERLRPLHTPFGESETIFLVAQEGVRFILMSRHGEQDYDISAPYVNYKANIFALKELGARNIIAWSGPGAIDKNLNVGDFIVPDDLIDETYGRESSFFARRGIGYMRQNPVFCPKLSKTLLGTLKKMKLQHHTGGTYVCTQGPRLETPAEINKYRILGSDIVGMVLAPECFLARELEMCYAPLCYISGYGEGVKKVDYKTEVLSDRLNTEEDQNRVEASIANIPRVIIEFFNRLEAEETECFCPIALEKHKKKGILGPDWHEWVT